MPYENEHSCRLKPPNYDKYARKNCYKKHDGKCIDFIFGIISPDESELQAMRYPKDIWTEEAAQSHCESKEGTFEPAKEEKEDVHEPRDRPTGIETRFLPAEMRVASDGTIEGYAAIFDVWSEVFGWFREKIRPGTFTKTVKESDVRALFNHDSNYVLGRTHADTLELKEDKKGLFFRTKPPDTQWAADLRTSIGRGDIDQASFQFDTLREEWNYDVDPIERELVEVRLYDVSVVTFPAYPQTNVKVRAAAEQLLYRVRDNPDVEKYVRDRLSQPVAPAAPGQGPHPAGSETDDKVQGRRRRNFRLMRLKMLK